MESKRDKVGEEQEEEEGENKVPERYLLCSLLTPILLPTNGT